MTKKNPHAPSAKLSQAGNGHLYYGPTPSGKMLDIQSDALPAGVGARVVDCYNALSPIQGDPAEALAKAREALDHFANFIGHPNPDKRERKDCELRAMAAATLAALGSPL
jgi:hypothetical protein